MHATLLLQALSLCLYVYPVDCFSSKYYDTKVTSQWELKDESLFHFHHDFHWQFHDLDIQATESVNLEDAFYGKNISVHIRRIVRNRECKVQKCKYCQGKGFITTHTDTPAVKKQLVSPCPVCLGTMYSQQQNCNMYYFVEEDVPVHIPPGCRLNYHARLEGKGNEIERNDSGIVDIGALDVLIDEISSGDFTVTETGIGIKILMTPIEALEGFYTERKYINNSVIKIDRRNKTTLPESEIAIPGLGLPKVMDTAYSHHEQIAERDDLIVTFDFVEEKNDDDDEEFLGPDTIIRSQDEFEEWNAKKEEKRNAAKRDKVIKSILYRLKDINDAREDDNEHDEDMSWEDE